MNQEMQRRKEQTNQKNGVGSGTGLSKTNLLKAGKKVICFNF